MATDRQSDARQAVLDDFTAALESQQGMEPTTRRKAAQVFEQALQDAIDHPKTSAQVLADWDQTMTTWGTLLNTMQQRNEISAVELADIVRQFDQVSATLQQIQQREASAARQGSLGEATTESAAILPQGMPADIARALDQSR